ncbi:MAG: glycosyltransferase family 2 protein [Candidatus Omnitrophota bacterium]
MKSSINCHTRDLTARKKCCVFTFVRNENVFLPIWLKYYSKFFSGSDIYVLDHSSDDGSVAECRKKYDFNVVDIPFVSYNVALKTSVARKKQADLLNVYEYVLYADADEIIIPHPRRYKDLNCYIKQLKKDYCFCKGYDLLQMKNETPINLDMPILRQRKYWSFSPDYCKPLLSKKPLEWELGFHNAKNIARNIENDLLLLHLHRMDFKIAWEKLQQIKSWEWDETQNRKDDISWQFRIKDKEKFELYFRPPDLKKERWWFIIAYAFIKIVLIVCKSPRASSLSERGYMYFRSHVYKKIPKCLIGKSI